MTSFELDNRKFERLPQRQQISTISKSTIEEVLEILEKSDVDISTDHYMIKPIVNRNFGSTFHHHNEPNQRQNIH